MSVMYKNNSVDPPKPTRSTLNTANNKYIDKNNRMNNNANKVNSTQGTTIKLNDYLFRLSAQEKLENTKPANHKNKYPISNDNKYNNTNNQSDSVNNKPWKPTQFENTIPAVEIKRSDSATKSPYNFTSPCRYNASNNTSHHTNKFQQPITSLDNSSIRKPFSHQTSYPSNINPYPSLKKFSAAPPPEHEQLVLKTSSEVVVMDTHNQSPSSDHFNSILRPREKKIIKPSENILKSCQTNDEVLTLDKSAFVEQFAYEDQSVFVADSKIEPSPLIQGRKSKMKQNPYNTNPAAVNKSVGSSGSGGSGGGYKYSGGYQYNAGGSGGVNKSGSGGGSVNSGGGGNNRFGGNSSTVNISQYVGNSNSSVVKSSYSSGNIIGAGSSSSSGSGGARPSVGGAGVSKGSVSTSAIGSSSSGGGSRGRGGSGDGEADYCNLDVLMGSKQQSDNQSHSIYVNDQPTPVPRRTLIADQADRVKRLNSFFGEKKDSVTELESKIFNELIMKEEQQKQQNMSPLSSSTNHKSINLTSSLPLDSRSIRSEVSVTSSTNEGERLKRVVKNNLKNFNKNLNKSCENLLTSIANSNTINNIPCWKKKLIKGVKSHFKQLKSDKQAAVIESHVLPINLCHMSATNQNLPILVECCTEVVEKRGLDVEGVYRLPSKHAIVNQLLRDIQKDPNSIDLFDEPWRDISCVGSLLKLFLRKLPDPLITQDLYESFIAASSMQATHKMTAIRTLVKKLPPTNHETLSHLAKHLHLVASHASKNTMDAHNLAIMFGPSLVHSKFKATKQMLVEMSAQIDVVENIIRYHEWIFSDKPVNELVLQENNYHNNNNNNNMKNYNNLNRFNKGDKISSRELLPSVETLLELVGSDEEEEEDEEGSKFSFLRNHFFTRSSKSARFYVGGDEFGVDENKKAGKNVEKCSLGGSYKKK